MGNVTIDAARTGDVVPNVRDDKSSSYNRNLIAAASDSFADLMWLIGLQRFDADEVTA